MPDIFSDGGQGEEVCQFNGVKGEGWTYELLAMYDVRDVAVLKSYAVQSRTKRGTSCYARLRGI